MEKVNGFLGKIPAILSGRVSIFIYILLFLYLVVFAGLCVLISQLNSLMPTDNMQLILGNYTNVLSALGASIAAGAGVAVHSSIKRIHQRHDELKQTIDELHEKIDQLREKAEK